MRFALAMTALALAAAAMTPAALAQQGQAAQAAPFRTVSSEDFAKAPGGAVLVDVREPSEWAQTGAPAGAQLISISRPDFVDAVLKAVSGDKSKPVAVICRSGSRSVKAAEQLSAAGFTKITNIGDGMIGREGVGKGWLAATLPLDRRDATQ
jgi:rhodanese-related sulfurtransferase